MGRRERRAEQAKIERRRRWSRLLLRLAGTAAAVSLIAWVLLLRGSPQAAAGTSFEIVSPRPGATTGSPAQVLVRLQGAQLGAPSAGLDHLHVSIDGSPAVALYQVPELTVPLAPGRHTVAVQLAGAAHEGILPAQTVSFTVGS